MGGFCWSRASEWHPKVNVCVILVNRYDFMSTGWEGSTNPSKTRRESAVCSMTPAVTCIDSTPLCVHNPRTNYAHSIVISFPMMELCWLQTWLHKSGMLPQGWVDVSQNSVPSSSSDLVLCKPRSQPLQNVTIGITLRVEPDFCWKLYFSSEELNSPSLLSSVPEHLNTVSQIVSMLTTLDDAKICEGSADAKFHVLPGWHKGVFMDPSGSQSYVYHD